MPSRQSRPRSCRSTIIEPRYGNGPAISSGAVGADCRAARGTANLAAPTHSAPRLQTERIIGRSVTLPARLSAGSTPRFRKGFVVGGPFIAAARPRQAPRVLPCRASEGPCRLTPSLPVRLPRETDLPIGSDPVGSSSPSRSVSERRAVGKGSQCAFPATRAADQCAPIRAGEGRQIALLGQIGVERVEPSGLDRGEYPRRPALHPAHPMIQPVAMTAAV